MSDSDSDFDFVEGDDEPLLNQDTSKKNTSNNAKALPKPVKFTVESDDEGDIMEDDEDEESDFEQKKSPKKPEPKKSTKNTTPKKSPKPKPKKTKNNPETDSEDEESDFEKKPVKKATAPKKAAASPRKKTNGEETPSKRATPRKKEKETEEDDDMFSDYEDDLPLCNIVVSTLKRKRAASTAGVFFFFFIFYRFFLFLNPFLIKAKKAKLSTEDKLKMRTEEEMPEHKWWLEVRPLPFYFIFLPFIWHLHSFGFALSKAEDSSSFISSDSSMAFFGLSFYCLRPFHRSHSLPLLSRDSRSLFFVFYRSILLFGV